MEYNIEGNRDIQITLIVQDLYATKMSSDLRLIYPQGIKIV